MADNETAPATETAEKPEPEFVLTPEIMAYENRRTDLIMAAAAVAFAFFLGSFKDEDIALFRRFRTGQFIAQQGIPKTDALLYTVNNAPWVNPSWLFDFGVYQVYDKFGDVVLGVLKSCAIAAAGVVLLCIRHRGPTLWWATLSTLAALVVMSAQMAIAPEVAAQLLFGGLLLLWHQAKYGGRFWMLYLSIPLTALWANLDLTYPLAPLFLLIMGVGELLQQLLPASFDFGGSRFSPRQALIVLGVAGGCALAALATPYGIGTLTLPVQWFTDILPIVSEHDKSSGDWLVLDLLKLIDRLYESSASPAEYAWTGLVLGTVGSFALNYPNLSFSRLLAAAAGVGLGIAQVRFAPYSAMLLAVAVSLNGQEFYLASWGTETRISRGWVLWSQGGRAMSIVLVFGLIFAAFTGRIQGLIGRFGFGIHEERYMAAAADWLNEVQPAGNTFAFTSNLAAYLSWRCPERKNFFDDRWQVTAYPQYDASADTETATGDAAKAPKLSPLQKFSLARRSLVIPAEMNPETWLRIFDDYHIGHIIIDPQINDVLVSRLLNSPLLVPVFISDQAVILARYDEKSPDKQLVETQRVDANKLAFRTKLEKPPRAMQRDVIAPGAIDRVWRTRDVLPTGVYAGHLFAPSAPMESRSLKDPGRYILGIRRLRDAIAENPDNSDAHLLLAGAYHRLYFVEAAQAIQASFQQREALQAKLVERAAAAKARKKDAVDPAAKGAKPEAPKALTEGAAQKPGQVAKGSDNSAAPPAAATNKVAEISAALPQMRRGGQPQQIQIPPPINLSMLRHYQIITELQNALIAKPDDARVHLQLGMLAKDNEFVDLALHHLMEYRRLVKSDEEKERFRTHVEDLTKEVDARREQFDNILKEQKEQQEKEGAAEDEHYVDRAFLARDLQLPMLAMEQLEQAPPYSPEIAQSAYPIAEFYMLLGLPSRAFAHLQTGGGQGSFAGQEDWIMSQIHAVNGQYEDSIHALEQAIAKVRRSRVDRSLRGFDMRVRAGIVLPVLSEIGDTALSLQREAVFRFTLSMLRIEMGEPKLAVDEFAKIIELNPHFGPRGIIDYYWPLITDAKPPAAAAAYDPESEIAVRFDQPAKEKAMKEKPTGAATDKAGDKPAKEAPAKANKDAKPTPAKAATAKPVSDKPAAAPK